MPRGRPSRQQVYEALERAVDELERVGGLPLPAEAQAIWKDIWHEETHHSTAIEGNTLILREVQLLLDQGKAVGAKDFSRYLEVQGYAEAGNWVYAQAVKSPAWNVGKPVSISEVREVHRLAVEPVWRHFPPDDFDPKEGPGSFRRHDIESFASGMTPPSWTDVPPLMTDWIKQANEEPPRDCHLVEHLADLHGSFERTHPFRDGNGRVGRLVLNLLFVRHGYPPAVVYKRDRDKYLRALQRADSGDAGSMGEMMARAVKHSVDRFILPGLAGPHKMVPISALAGNGLSHNALALAAQRGRLQASYQNGQWYSTQKLVAEYRESRYQRRGTAQRRKTAPILE